MSNNTNKQKSLFNMNDIYFVLCLFLSLSVLLFIIHTIFKPIIATVDLPVLIDEFVMQQANLNLDEATQLQQVQDFSHRLEASVALLAKRRQVILLPRAAVIAGAEDLTPVLKEQLNDYP